MKGPKVTLRGQVPEGIEANVQDGTIRFVRGSDSKEARRLHGLARALTNNMVIGATTGFTRRLEIEGVGYRADVRGKELHLLLGYSHPIVVPIPEGLTVTADGNTKLAITGADKGVGRTVRRRRALAAAAGAVQGQGRQVRRRTDSPQGRQGRSLSVRNAGEHEEEMKKKIPNAKRRMWLARKARTRTALERSERVLLTVFRSGKHTYAQLVDRESGNTLATASTLDAAIAGEGSTAQRRSRQAGRRGDRAHRAGEADRGSGLQSKRVPLPRPREGRGGRRSRGGASVLIWQT